MPGAGPLDRWLRRAPLEPVQPSADDSDATRSQQTAEPPVSSAEQQVEEPLKRSGTLDSFLTRSRSTEESQEELDERRPRQRQRRFIG